MNESEKLDNNEKKTETTEEMLKKAVKNDKKDKAEKKAKKSNKKDEKKKNPTIVVIIVLVVLALIAVIGYFGTLKIIKVQVNSKVSSAFSALKTGDGNAKNEFLNYDEVVNGTDESGNDVFNCLFSKLDYKILSSKVDFKSATVKVEVTNKDVGTVFGNYFAKLIELSLSSAFSNKMSDEEMNNQLNAYLVDQVNSDQIQNITNTIDINLVKENGKWKITNDQASLINVVLPGFVQKLDAVNTALNSLESQE